MTVHNNCLISLLFCFVYRLLRQNSLVLLRIRRTRGCCLLAHRADKEKEEKEKKEKKPMCKPSPLAVLGHQLLPLTVRMRTTKKKEGQVRASSLPSRRFPCACAGVVHRFFPATTPASAVVRDSECCAISVVCVVRVRGGEKPTRTGKGEAPGENPVSRGRPG